jgi:hypothetical protein
LPAAAEVQIVTCAQDIFSFAWYNEARKCPLPQQVGARIPKQAASISPASLKRQEEVLPMAKLEQWRYKNTSVKY